MAETASIPEDLLRSRLDAFEDMRRFFFEMWLQNPSLAANLGSRLRAMLEPLSHPPAP